MLTVHATRAQLGLVDMKPRWWRRAGISGVILIIAVALPRLFSVGWKSMECLELTLFSIVVGVQVALVVEAHVNRFKSIETFYNNLSSRRATGLDDEAAKEYVESYRHLREHGNAYAIIVLEFILALALNSAPQYWQKAVLLFLWIVPAGYCWLIPTLLEARFASKANAAADKQKQP